MDAMKPYDWAQEYNVIHRTIGKYHRAGQKTKGICPEGHECHRSNKAPEWERYFYCYNEHKDSEIKGMYFPESKIK